MALQCAGPLALWQQDFPAKHSIAAHGTAVHCSPLRTRCRALSARCRREEVCSISRRRSWASKVLASDSQAQDEEQEEEVVWGEDGISNADVERLLGKYPQQDLEPPSPEDSTADSDALTLAMALASAANEVKAVDLKVLYVKPLVYWTRYFIIASGYSMPQVNAISGKLEKLCKDEFKILSRTHEKTSPWTLLDFGDVVVHVFLPQQRRRYNLEEYYSNAPVVDLPFEAEPCSPEYFDIEDEYEEEYESEEEDEEDDDVEEDDEEYLIDSGDEEEEEDEQLGTAASKSEFEEEELGTEDATSTSEFEQDGEDDEEEEDEEDQDEDKDDSEAKPRRS